MRTGGIVPLHIVVNGEKVQEVRIFYNFVGEVAEMEA